MGLKSLTSVPHTSWFPFLKKGHKGPICRDISTRSLCSPVELGLRETETSYSRKNPEKNLLKGRDPYGHVSLLSAPSYEGVT